MLYQLLLWLLLEASSILMVNLETCLLTSPVLAAYNMRFTVD
jgi:hypothetical protein